MRGGNAALAGRVTAALQAVRWGLPAASQVVPEIESNRRAHRSGEGSDRAECLLGRKLLSPCQPCLVPRYSTEALGNLSNVTITRDRLEELLLCEVTQMATVAQNTVTMQMMIKMGEMPTEAALLSQAQFIHRELATRFAVRTKEFERLPTWARDQSHMCEARNLYMDSFRRLRLLPCPKDMEGEKQLTELLRGVQLRHANIVESLALGMQELKRSGIINTDLRIQQMNDFLSRNLRSRIGTVLLTSQHLAMQPETARVGWVGNINLRCCPVAVIEEAVNDATCLCDRVYGNAPEVVIRSNLDGATFSLFPASIHYIAVELLKNGMRATMEKHGEDPPPVELNIGYDGLGRLGIEVRDLGGGIPQKIAEKVWDWSFTTVERGDESSGTGGSSPAAASTTSNSSGLLAGLGFGLPLSRLHARYFGGDIQLISLPGLSTSAFYHVDTIGKIAEDIPEAYTRDMRFRFDIPDQ